MSCELEPTGGLPPAEFVSRSSGGSAPRVWADVRYRWADLPGVSGVSGDRDPGPGRPLSGTRSAAAVGAGADCELCARDSAGADRTAHSPGPS